MKRLKSIGRAIAESKSGNVALVFALVMPVMVTASLGVVDVSRATSARARLQDALDASALIAARSGAATDADLQTQGSKALAANIVNMKDATLVASSFKNDTDGITILASASADVDTTILGLFSANKLAVSAASKIVRASNDVEVALVLDTSGSMAGSKIADLKTAASDLVDIVVQTAQTPYYSKVAIVSYATGVNVGSYANSVRGTPTTGTCTHPGCQNFKFSNPWGQQDTYAINTCVSERSGGSAYTDDPPSTSLLGPNYASPSNPCSTSPILPLTSNKTTLKTAISDLVAGGSTAGQVGVAWGWYLLAPNFGYLWPTSSTPAAYKKTKLIKAVVLMTDGEYNSVYCKGVIAQDAATGSGSSYDHINCNAPNGNAYGQAKTLCTNMKKAGVIVYTVGLNVINTANAKDLISSCASDASHVYYPADGTALKDAFKSIAQSISDLRIAQ